MNLPQSPRLLFLFLKAFITTGGIEKVNRILLRILKEMQDAGQIEVQAATPYTAGSDIRYFPDERLKGYQGQRWRFMLDMLLRPPKVDILLVGHINLAPAAWLLRLRYPRLRVILMAHGIEVWRPLNWFKRQLVQKADRIVAVSEYTKTKLIVLHGVQPDHISVVPNCLDPYFELPIQFEKPDYLMERYGLRAEQKVLLTISRLSAHEGYKGYDRVLTCLPQILQHHPDLCYILAGKYDTLEKKRLDQLLQQHGIEQQVQITGYLPDAELSDHYLLADAFVMPSQKEGFGIVFIESMACGTPAIGGNQDGSPEALRPGELGYTVDPDNTAALTQTILQVLEQPGDPAQLQQKTLERFGYEQYREKWGEVMQ